jgi:hypothetical protein
MRGRKWIVTIAVVVLAVAAVVIARNSGSVTAFQGSDCFSYQLPKGAVAYMSAVAAERNTITIVYRMPDGSSGHKITVPFDAIDATCTDLQIREIVSSAHEGNRKIKESMCRFIADVLSGRVRLPPGKGDHYDLAYAREWYRKSC